MSTPPVTDAAVQAALVAGNEHVWSPGGPAGALLPPILDELRVRRMLDAAAPHMVWAQPPQAARIEDFEEPPRVVHIRDTDVGISGDSIR